MSDTQEDDPSAEPHVPLYWSSAEFNQGERTPVGVTKPIADRDVRLSVGINGPFLHFQSLKPVPSFLAQVDADKINTLTELVIAGDLQRQVMGDDLSVQQIPKGGL